MKYIPETKYKECWVNVYNDGTVGYWYGLCYPEKLNHGVWRKYLIYRIHVRLK